MRIGFPEMFPRLSIRAKLLIAFVGLSILPFLLVSLYGLYSNVRTMRQVALENLTHDVGAIQARTGNFIGSVEGDMRVLLNSSVLQRYCVGHGTESAATERGLLRLLANEFLALARTKRIYYQIRLLDRDRGELLRVECDDIADSASHFAVLPPERLRGEGGAYYSLLTGDLRRDQITCFPVELLYRVTERIPVISFAAPLNDGVQRVGILIANVFAGDLFRELETQRGRGSGGKVVLVGSDGHFLYNSEEQNNWNRLIASREEDNLQKDYPPPVAAAILSGREGIIGEGSDDIIAYAPLFPTRLSLTRPSASSVITSSLFVFETVPRSVITRDARASALTFALLLLAFLGAAVGLGLLATRQFTRPISEVRQGAEVISRGNYRHRLDVATGDEIEELARQFNRMAASLEDHEREIQQHRNRLEEMVDHRTRELVGEKGKLQAVLDNVPSALVMLDNHYRILTASAAFATVTGLRLDDVRGQDSRAVYRANGLCQQADEAGGASARVESHMDRRVDRKGSEHYLEHVTIPISEHAKVTSILQIITDVTKRKRVEEHLIHSEKLMATGEMAAIIAHGFRNSLTSIKMILQLQQESKHLGPVNRKSLRVALDSIYRMETVVQELLTFARPSPMEFRPCDLNALVNESVTLVRPRFREHGVSLAKRLHARMPPLVLDAAHLREAFVNVLLNAVQAVESHDRMQGKVSIVTHTVVLGKTMRDFQSSAAALRDAAAPGDGPEIILRKGSACVAIRIEDNGPGMDRPTLARIFDPFFTTKTNGTGLGLPMVKRTVNAHGGIVAVKSTKGKGTTMEIVLPLRTDPSGAGTEGNAS